MSGHPGPDPGHLALLDQRASELRDVLDSVVSWLREHNAQCDQPWCGMSQIITGMQDTSHPDCTAELLGYAVQRLATTPKETP